MPVLEGYDHLELIAHGSSAACRHGARAGCADNPAEFVTDRNGRDRSGGRVGGPGGQPRKWADDRGQPGIDLQRSSCRTEHEHRDVAQWHLVRPGGACYQLLNVHSGLALDNPNGTFANGVQMQQWQVATGNDNQIWCFQAVGDSWYSIRNQTSGSLVDVRDGLGVEGSAIQQWRGDPLSPNANQTWQSQAVS
jgi:Ricin-type beta-trefoil lectin domain-like